MKRRFVAICLTVISLLTSCGKAKLRSDIIEFIASFSIDLAVENYPSASYKRENISTENGVTSKEVKTMSINRKNPDNLAYIYEEITYENDVEKTSLKRYIEKNNDKYLYVSEEGSIEKTKEQVNALINNFFYTSSSNNIYTGGMFMGDAFREILPDIQDLVTIDSENKLLVYSYVNVMNEDNKEVRIAQDVTLDQYGMLVKEDMVKTSDLGVFETHIEVKK